VLEVILSRRKITTIPSEESGKKEVTRDNCRGKKKPRSTRYCVPILCLGGLFGVFGGGGFLGCFFLLGGVFCEGVVFGVWGLGLWVSMSRRENFLNDKLHRLTREIVHVGPATCAEGQTGNTTLRRPVLRDRRRMEGNTVSEKNLWQKIIAWEGRTTPAS